MPKPETGSSAELLVKYRKAAEGWRKAVGDVWRANEHHIVKAAKGPILDRLEPAKVELDIAEKDKEAAWLDYTHALHEETRRDQAKTQKIIAGATVAMALVGGATLIALVVQIIQFVLGQGGT